MACEKKTKEQISVLAQEMSDAIGRIADVNNISNKDLHVILAKAVVVQYLELSKAVLKTHRNLGVSADSMACLFVIGHVQECRKWAKMLKKRGVKEGGERVKDGTKVS